MQSDQPQQPYGPAAAERDTHTFVVADHGVDPTPLPAAGSGASGPAHAKPGSHIRATKSVKPDNANSDKFGFRDFLIWCGIPVVVVLLIRLFILPLYWIPSSSMMNTILKNDRVATLSTHISPASKLQRGDIIVFKDPANWLGQEDTSGHNGYLIKRLIGLPGDVVECAGAGSPITVNGVAVDESAYVAEGSDPSAFAFKVTVTEGNLFVMGDNRAHSADSRFHLDDGNNGLVPMANVSGRAWLIYWPLGRFGLLDSHHEVFASVPSASASGSTV